MVVPDQVEGGVDEQQRQFVVEAPGVVGGLTGRHLGAEHDVAEHERGAVGSGAVARRRRLVDREGQDIGG